MAAFRLECKAATEGEGGKSEGMQGTRNEEQPVQKASDVQRMIEESRKAMERLRRLIWWRTLESIRANTKK